MIGIRINRTHWLDLFKDTSLQVTLSSPVFSGNIAGENVVYNFSIPNNPRNASILSHPGRVSVFSPIIKFHIEFFFDMRPIGEGTAVLKKVYSRSIEIVSGLNESSFFNLIGDTFITDFNYGGELHYNGDYVTNPNSIYNIPNSIYPDVPFAYFPVLNESLYNGSDLEYIYKNIGLDTPFVSAERMYQNDFLCTAGDGDPDWYIGNAYSVTPFPYVARVIAGILEESGYIINRNDFTKSDALSRLCIYNPNIAPHEFVSPLNQFYIRLAEHLPAMKTAEFLTAIKKPFGLNFLVNEKTSNIDIKLFDQLLDSRDRIDKYFVQDELSEGQNIKYTVPVDSSDSYAADWQKPEELEKHNNRGMVLTYALLSTISNPVKGDIALVWEENYFYLYDQDDTQAYVWKKFAYNQQSVSIGDFENNTDVKMDFTGAYCEEHDVKTVVTGSGWANDTWFVPKIEMPGNIKDGALAPSTPYNDFGLKLLFYWGYEETQTYSRKYPVGSSTIYKGGGNGILQTDPLPSLSLFPNHENNFIDLYLKKYTSILNNARTRSIKKTMYLTELQEIDFLRTVLMDGRKWLHTKIQFNITSKGLSEVSAELREIF